MPTDTTYLDVILPSAYPNSLQPCFSSNFWQYNRKLPSSNVICDFTAARSLKKRSGLYLPMMFGPQKVGWYFSWQEAREGVGIKKKCKIWEKHFSSFPDNIETLNSGGNRSTRSSVSVQNVGHIYTAGCSSVLPLPFWVNFSKIPASWSPTFRTITSVTIHELLTLLVHPTLNLALKMNASVPHPYRERLPTWSKTNPVITSSLPTWPRTLLAVCTDQNCGSQSFQVCWILLTCATELHQQRLYINTDHTAGFQPTKI